MQAIFKEKKVWDIVYKITVKKTIQMQIRKKKKNNAIALKIIKQRVNFNFYTNTIGKYNSQWY